jgi:hypothetical protein
MFNHVKGSSEVKFKNNDLSFGLVILTEEFKTPSKTILNSLAFDEDMLVLVDNFEDHLLKTAGEKLGE